MGVRYPMLRKLTRFKFGAKPTLLHAFQDVWFSKFWKISTAIQNFFWIDRKLFFREPSAEFI